MFKRIISFTFFILILFPFSLRAQDSTAFDFTLTESFLKQLLAQNTIQPTFNLHFDARSSKVHTLSGDCEIHIATTPDLTIGSPSSVVVEPPNLCKFFPPDADNTLSETKLRNVIWPQLLDDKVMDKDCKVKGFFRIFTEHASGSEAEANPNHVFEIHPAMSIIAGNDTLSFVKYLKAFERMRAIKPATTLSCITKRTLEVRYDENNDSYQFRQNGGRCGNFAIVEVTNIIKDWVHKLNGGHYAIVRISADGESTQTLKIYTLAGTGADTLLSNIMSGQPQSNDRLYLHGMFTYDYWSIITTVHKDDSTWDHPSSWKDIKYPLAFVVFGKTDTIPWDEE